MNKPDNDFSRLNRKRGRSSSDKILNILIALVVVAIIITASVIFLGGKSENQADKKGQVESDNNKTDVLEDETDESNENSEDTPPAENDESTDDIGGGVVEDEGEDKSETDENEDAGSVTYESVEDEIIEKTITNTGWQPIGTEQKGEHVSSYEKNTVDWIEKQKAISYATGLPVDSMIYWMIKNGGTPQKSIGIVSSKDKVEKYRVYLEWVDEKGWKPVKMDVLKTLDFDY